MSQQLTNAEKQKIQMYLVELKLAHRGLDKTIYQMIELADVEELQLKRLKKEKLRLKETIERLETSLIPDILA